MLRLVDFRAPFDRRRSAPPSLADCIVEREKPWLLTIWEPLPTKAPSPANAQPWCCYINTVIFYARPYRSSATTNIWRDGDRYRIGSKGQLVVYDKVETRMIWDDVVEFEGERFTVGGGEVVWRSRNGIGRRWWSRRTARREVPRHA